MHLRPPTNTNYYFNVATSALAGALERFSGFFHSPLFAPSGTVRELNAVDSEHKKNLQNDIWRILSAQQAPHKARPCMEQVWQREQSELDKCCTEDNGGWRKEERHQW
jgi:hypothetical protein